MHSLTRQADIREIRDRLLAVRVDDAAQWGVMNAAEMMCHLRAAFRVAMGEIPSEPMPMPVPRAAVKAMALWAPVPWKHNFESIPVLRRGSTVMQPGEFDDDRDEALAEMERFCRPDQTRVDHSFFGSMSFEDWMRWGYLHTDHHLRQFGR